MRKLTRKNKRSLSIILVISLFFSLGFKILDDGDDFELIKNLEIYHNVMKQLRVNYVDEIDSRQIITLSIDKMLEDLDPYTVYYPESEIESVRLISEAKYVGVGISIDTFMNEIYVTDIENNSSAHTQGILIGDKVLSVNEIETNANNLSDFDRLIAGQANTFVRLKIERNGEEKNYSLIRKNIELPVVSLVEKIDNFGYIKLETFSATSASEVETAFLKLEKQGIEGLILDLRDNPGGLLDQAVKIVNLFIKKDMLVVTSKGKAQNSNGSFFTKSKPVNTKIPIVVLVNGGSASASEIVAGALQDYDRAIIVGSQTYGKGLVQRIFDVGYNSKVKVTISKYYIPSGRCIQAIDYAKNNYKKHIISDTKFYTTNGRVVYEGNGIKPDIVINSDTLPEGIKNLKNSKNIFIFTNKYYQDIDTATIKNAREQYFTDKNSFYDFLNTSNYYETTADIIRLNQILNSPNITDEITNQIKTTKSLLKKSIEKNIDTNFDYIKLLVSEELIKRKYLHKGEIEFSLSHDSEIKKAKFYLSNSNEYKSILGEK